MFGGASPRGAGGEGMFFLKPPELDRIGDVSFGGQTDLNGGWGGGGGSWCSPPKLALSKIFGRV